MPDYFRTHPAKKEPRTEIFNILTGHLWQNKRREPTRGARNAPKSYMFVQKIRVLVF